MQIDFTETPDISYKTKVSNILYSQAMLQPDEINYLIDGMLAEHAHELADKIREARAGNCWLCTGKAVCQVCGISAVAFADLIDPEVEKP